jgi:hypothetical protein
MTATLTNQVAKLISSLPGFEASLRKADRNSAVKWQIVRWREIAPERVTPDVVEPVLPESFGMGRADNRFDSLSAALEASARWVRSTYDKPLRSERGHWGVWAVHDPQGAYYQSVAPCSSRDNGAAESSSKPSATVTGGSSMVRLNDRAHRQLKVWAEEDGRTLQDMLEVVVWEYDRHRFFDKAEAAYRRLKANPEAWEDELAERRILEGSLMDDLEEREAADREPIASGGGSPRG